MEPSDLGAHCLLQRSFICTLVETASLESISGMLPVIHLQFELMGPGTRCFQYQ